MNNFNIMSLLNKEISPEIFCWRIPDTHERLQFDFLALSLIRPYSCIGIRLGAFVPRPFTPLANDDNLFAAHRNITVAGGGGRMAKDVRYSGGNACVISLQQRRDITRDLAKLWDVSSPIGINDPDLSLNLNSRSNSMTQFVSHLFRIIRIHF